MEEMKVMEMASCLKILSQDEKNDHEDSLEQRVSQIESVVKSTNNDVVAIKETLETLMQYFRNS